LVGALRIQNGNSARYSWTSARLSSHAVRVCEFANSRALQKQYEPCFRLNPFFILGDFDGDHLTDAAILVRNPASGQVGIVVIQKGSKDLMVFGAGIALGNGGADFSWMDNWTLYPKSARALIYWNGRDYGWYQESD
jgi:hypothetical protein